MSLEITNESHLDHDLSLGHLEWLKAQFRDKNGFFIATVDLPEAFSTLDCGLYGPSMGDDPIPEDQVQYVIDFAGPALDALPEDAKVEAISTANANGRVLESLAYKLNRSTFPTLAVGAAPSLFAPTSPHGRFSSALGISARKRKCVGRKITTTNAVAYRAK